MQCTLAMLTLHMAQQTTRWMYVEPEDLLVYLEASVFVLKCCCTLAFCVMCMNSLAYSCTLRCMVQPRSMAIMPAWHGLDHAAEQFCTRGWRNVA